MSDLKRPSGEFKKNLVIGVVSSDSTFSWDDKIGKWDGRCLICDARVVVWPNGSTASTLEHIVPLSKGGDNSLKNLAITCQVCNTEKSRRADKMLDVADCSVVKSLLAKRMIRWVESDDLKNDFSDS